MNLDNFKPTLKKTFTYFALKIFIISSFFFLFFQSENIECKATKKTTSIKKAPSSKKKVKSKKKRKRRIRYIKPRKIITDKKYKINTINDQLLAQGVNYKVLQIGNGKLFHSAHIIEYDLTNRNNNIEVLKGKNYISGLEKLQDISRLIDTTTNKTLLAAINTNFWRAYTNYPIGPVVIGGEVVQIHTHKNWTSAFFDISNRLYIGNFYLSANLFTNSNKTSSILTNIDHVNYRRDTSDIVLYNHYAGDVIPYIPKQNLEYLIKEALEELDFSDSTETEFDTLAFKQNFIQSQKNGKIEYSIPKIALKYLKQPGINTNIPCVVISNKNTDIEVPKNGCVISFGNSIPNSLIPKLGDTLILRYSTNIHSDIIFSNAISGTPRLVRDGIAEPENYEEGSNGKRFVYQQLPRTAIGINNSNTKLYLVVIEPSNGKDKFGASLKDIALIMKIIGCCDALNLDGGGSTTMIVRGKNVIYKANPEAGRRISVGFGISTKKLTTEK